MKMLSETPDDIAILKKCYEIGGIEDPYIVTFIYTILKTTKKERKKFFEIMHFIEEKTKDEN